MKLTKKDYKAIDQFMVKYNQPEGKGIRILLECFLEEYKESTKLTPIKKHIKLKPVTNSFTTMR